MKKISYYVATLLLAGSLWTSCSDNDSPADKPLVLTGGTTTEQVVYADETNKAEGIKFTAAAPWTATVTEVNAKTRANGVAWLTLSAYEGGAGEQNLTLTLQPNLTGQDRAAEIAITCGETVIRIRVEQKGVKQDGQKPEGAGIRFVDYVIKKWTGADGTGQDIVEFTYHPDGSLKLMSVCEDLNQDGTIDNNERKNAFDFSSEFTYEGKTVKMHIINVDKGAAGQIDESNAVLSLNDEGYVTKLKFEGEANETITHEYKNGYIISTTSSSKYQNETTNTMTWKNENLVTVIDGSYQTEVAYGNEVNRPDVSIDLNFVCTNSEWYSSFGEDGELGVKIAGLMGKRSKNLMKTEEVAGYGKEMYSYSYTQDDKGYVSKIEMNNNSESTHRVANTVYTIHYKN